ncbi:acetaldehyde dehydrogenase, partial [Pseudonocardia sp. Ae263_Ps1]|uniref:acetaldehyde dehydrogenase n=1 Tax=Pseudonocardia sp. Ae263_Ps1 TaxID=1885030 RepID=UPI001C37B4F1
MTAAVLGAGLIGVDMADKVMRSDVLELGLVAGRSSATAGLRQAARLGFPTSDRGIRALVEVNKPFDVVFDATNALAHATHARMLEPLEVLSIDLTPSRAGLMVVPTVPGERVSEHRDVSMVTCGGQAAIPVLHAIASAHDVGYVEVVTTAATLSVGHGTRVNLDEYVETTQDAIRSFTGITEVKAILNVSPARPPATFRVAMTVLGAGFREESVRALAETAAA